MIKPLNCSRNLIPFARPLGFISALLVSESQFSGFCQVLDTSAAGKTDLPILSNSPSISLQNLVGDPDWLDLKASFVSHNNGTPDANDHSIFTSSNLATLDLRLWLNQWQGNGNKNGFNINVIGTQRFGEILSNEIPNKLNTQWSFGNGPIGRLSVLSLEYSNSDSFLSQFKIGKLKQSIDFTMDGVFCNFSNFGLCGWAEGTPSMIAIPGNPFNAYGAMARLGDPDTFSFKYGIYQIYPESFAPKYHGLDFRISNNTGYAQFFQLDARLPSTSLIPSVQSQHGGVRRSSLSEEPNILYKSPLTPPVIKLGGWIGDGVYDNVNLVGDGSSNNGIYGLMSIPFDPGKLAMDGRLFASGGLGLSQDVQSFRGGGNAGVVLAGVFANRPFDTLSFGYAYADYNKQLPTEDFRPSVEHALELNYNFSITPNFKLMPNLQVIMQPLGNDDAPAVWVGGLQAVISF